MLGEKGSAAQVDMSLFVEACLGQGEVAAWQDGLWSCLKYQEVPFLGASARKYWLFWRKISQIGIRVGRLSYSLFRFRICVEQ